MKKIFLPLIVLTLLSRLNAQNYIFEEGQSGISFAGSYVTSKNDGVSSSSYRIHPSYTFNGKLTFGVSASFNELSSSSGIAITPNLSYVFYKKTSDMGILNIGLSGSYSFQSFDQFNIKVSALGPLLSYQFNFGDQSKISLLGRYVFGNSQTSIKNSDLSVGVNQNSYGFSVNFLSNNFYAEPSIAFAERDGKTLTVYGFSLGYIF